MGVGAMKWTYELGQQVTSSAKHPQHDRWVGTVTARELYSHVGGEGEYVYVRWTKPDGELCGDLMRLHVSEVT